MTVIHSALVTVDTGPDSGPEEKEYSSTGATSSPLVMPVGWRPSVEAEASMELGANLALDLTTVTGVTVELASGTDAEELTFTFAVKSEIWA